MRTVLVTGGAGFIGSHLTARLLERGLGAVCLDDFDDCYDPAFKRGNVAAFPAHPSWTLVEGDSRDTALVQETYRRHRVSATVHLAARAGVRPSIREPRRCQEVNGLGTLKLLEAARKYGAYTFIFGSSWSVYGINSMVPFAEDDTITGPVSPYAARKRANEPTCDTYDHLYGLKITCLRFSTVYGPRRRPEMAVYLFTGALARGQAVAALPDGSTARDYNHIDDIVDGSFAAVDADAAAPHRAHRGLARRAGARRIAADATWRRADHLRRRGQGRPPVGLGAEGRDRGGDRALRRLVPAGTTAVRARPATSDA